VAKFKRQNETTAKMFRSIGVEPQLLGAEKFKSKL
jgi:hypothetical protein